MNRLEARPGHSSRRAMERAKVKRLCNMVSRTERAPSQSQCLAKELLGLYLLVTPQERDRHVGRRDQRPRVICTEQAGLLDEDLSLDLHGLGVLALLRERGRQVTSCGERVAVVATESVSLLLERASVECLYFHVLSHILFSTLVRRPSVRVHTARPERTGPRGERRPQEHRCPRALAEDQNRDSRFKAARSVWRCSGSNARVRASRTPCSNRTASA